MVCRNRSLAVVVVVVGALGYVRPPGCRSGPSPVGRRPSSYVCPPAPFGHELPTGPREPYTPHEGDLFFFAYDSTFYRSLYLLAWTGPPSHVGIVVKLPDGRLALLEAGAWDFRHIYLIDVMPRLHSYEGDVWVRRLRRPLTAEQSANLTRFAVDQAGKRYALGRLALEVTPLRNHGPVNAWLFGRPWTERRSWLCSELTVAAACHAGLLDPELIPPNTVYPRDLYRDDPYDLSPWWEGPRRWTEEAAEPAPAQP
jgi:hypothetical protein